MTAKRLADAECRFKIDTVARTDVPERRNIKRLIGYIGIEAIVVPSDHRQANAVDRNAVTTIDGRPFNSLGRDSQASVATCRCQLLYRTNGFDNSCKHYAGRARITGLAVIRVSSPIRRESVTVMSIIYAWFVPAARRLTRAV